MADFNTLLGLRRQPVAPSASAPDPLTDEQLNAQIDREGRRTLARRSPFSAGLHQGIDSTIADAHGLAGLIKGAVGDESGARSSYAAMRANQREAQDYTPEISRIEDVHGPGDALAYGAYQLGAATPGIVSTVAPALLTDGSSALVESELRKAAASAVARAAGKEAVEREAASLGAHEAAGAAARDGLRRQAAENVATRAGQTLGKNQSVNEAERAAASAYADSASGKAVSDAHLGFSPRSKLRPQIAQHGGAVAGGALVSAGDAAGDVDPNATDAELRTQSREALAGDIGLGALQAAPGIALLHRYGVGAAAEEAIAKRLGAPLLKRITREAGEQAAIGGATSGAAAVASHALHHWITGEGQAVAGPGALSEYLNAAAAGAVAGAAFGAPAGLRGEGASAIKIPSEARFGLNNAKRKWFQATKGIRDGIAEARAKTNRPAPGEEINLDGSRIEPTAGAVFKQNLDDLQNDIDNFGKSLLSDVKPYDVTSADPNDPAADLHIGTSHNVPGAKLFDPAKVEEVAAQAKQLGLKEGRAGTMEHAVASLLPEHVFAQEATVPGVKATAAALTHGFDNLTTKQRAAVGDFIDQLPPELQAGNGPVMRLLATTNKLAHEGDLHRLSLAPRKTGDAVEPADVQKASGSDTGLEGGLTELDAAPSSDLGYVPDKVWNAARFGGKAADRGSPANENIQLTETGKNGKPRTVSFNIKRAASALTGSAEGRALLEGAKDRKTAALMGVAAEAAARGTPIDPKQIRPGLRVLPDKDGEKGTLTPLEAKAAREQLSTKSKAKAAPNGVRRPQRDVATHKTAAAEESGKTYTRPREALAEGSADKRALGEGDFEEGADHKLGPRQYKGAGSGETTAGNDFKESFVKSGRKAPRAHPDAQAAVDLRKAFLADRAKLEKKGAQAKTPAAKRDIFAQLKKRTAKYMADAEAQRKAPLSRSVGVRDRGTADNPVAQSAHAKQEYARIRNAADKLKLKHANDGEEGTVNRPMTTEHIAALYRAAKRMKPGGARTALLGAARRLADDNEHLTSMLDAVDRPTKKTVSEHDSLRHDTDLPDPPLSRGDADKGSVLDSVKRAKKDPAYKALFKAISDLNKGRGGGKGALEKTQGLVDVLAKAFAVPRINVKFFDPGTKIAVNGAQHALGLGALHTSKDGHTMYLRADLKAHERASVMLHEFGHHLQNHLFNRLADDHPTRKAVETAFNDWLGQHSTDATYASIKASRAPFFRNLLTLRKAAGIKSATLAEMTPKQRNYVLHFDEFFADMTARALEQHTPTQGIVGQFFAKVAHAMKLVYDLLPGHDKRLTDTPDAFKTFVHDSFMAGSEAAPEGPWAQTETPSPAAKAAAYERAGGDETGAGATPPGDPPPPARPVGGPHGGAGSSPSDVSAILSPRDRAAIAKLVTRRDVFDKIIQRWPHLTDRLLDYSTQMETAIDAGYALWALGQLPKSGAMDRFGTQALAAFGVKSKTAMAHHLFETLIAGEYRKGQDTRAVLRASRAFALTRAYKRAEARGEDVKAIALKTARAAQLGLTRAVDAYESHLKPIGGRLLTGLDARLRATNVPALRKLASMVHLQTGEQGTQAMTAKINHQRAQFWGKYGDITSDLNKADRKRLVNALRTRTTLRGPLETTRKQLLAHLKQLRQYQLDAGAEVGDVKDYWPVHLSLKKVQDNADEFRSILSEPDLFNGMKRYLAGLYARQGKSKSEISAALRGLKQSDAVDMFYRMAAHEPDTNVGGVSYAADTLAKPGGSEFRPRVSEFLYQSGRQDLIDRFAKFQTDDLDTVMLPYISKAVRRAEFHRAFIDTNEKGERVNKLNALYAQARDQGATDADIKLAQQYVDASLGVLGSGRHPLVHKLLSAVDGVFDTKLSDTSGRHWQRISNALIAYQNLRVLGLGMFGNMIDPLGVWVRSSNVGDTWHGYKQAAGAIFKKGGNGFLRGHAEDLGVAERHALSEALAHMYGYDSGQEAGSLSNRINSAVFKYNGMELITKFARTAALAAAHRFLLRHADGANAHSARYLRELGLTAADVKADPQHPGYVQRSAKIDAALHRFVDESVLRPAPTQRPSWQNDPHFALAAQYKGYLYSFYNTIVKRMLHEAHHGNVAGVAPMVGYIGVTMAAELAREMVQYGVGGNPHRKDWDAGDYMAYAVHRSGLLGPQVDFWHSAKQEAEHSSVPIPYESLTGPTVEQLGGLGDVTFGHGSGSKALATALPGQAIYHGWFAAPSSK